MNTVGKTEFGEVWRETGVSRDSKITPHSHMGHGREIISRVIAVESS